MFSEKNETLIEKQPLRELERGFRACVDMEVELEAKLKVIQEVKTRLMIEIDIRVNKK